MIFPRVAPTQRTFPAVRDALRGCALACLIFLSVHAAADSVQALPADVTINQNAGRGGLLIVDLELKDGTRVPFVVDSGAGATVFDVSFESELGNRLRTETLWHFSSSFKENVYAAPPIFLNGTHLVTGSNVVTYDFKHQNTSPAGKRIIGILGFDCLRHYCIQLDFQAAKLRFLDPDHLDTSNLGTAYPIDMRGRPFIHHASFTGGTSTNCLIDTGCSYDGRVGEGTVKGDHSGWARLPECTWDGLTYTNLHVQAGENADMIGLRFLARHLVTLDFPNHTLYLKQTSIGPLK